MSFWNEGTIYLKCNNIKNFIQFSIICQAVQTRKECSDLRSFSGQDTIWP